MNEYISRSAALSAIGTLYPSIPIADTLYDEWHEKNKPFMECESAIEQIPAADVRENVRGKWITDPEDLEWGNALKKIRCSQCKKRPPYDWQNRKFILSDFCPACGADMRGGGGDE